jgi:hypothetical protein
VTATTSDAVHRDVPPTPDGPAVADPVGSPSDRALRGWIHVEHFRWLRHAGLRRTALASVPVWIAVRWTVPGLLAWIALLVHASCAVEAAAYAWLEHRSVLRTKAVNAAPAATLHFVSSTGQRAASGLWYAACVVSFVPWLAVAMGRAASLGARALVPIVAGTMSVLVLGATLLDGLRGQGTRSHDPSEVGVGEAKVMKPELAPDVTQAWARAGGVSRSPGSE